MTTTKRKYPIYLLTIDADWPSILGDSVISLQSATLKTLLGESQEAMSILF